MTRTHFEAIAHALLLERPDPIARQEHAAWSRCVVAMADTCAAYNRAFDRGRFYRAAGLDR